MAARNRSPGDLAASFVGIIATVGTLLSIRYPVVVETVLPMYNADCEWALHLTSLLTFAAFAAVTVVARLAGRAASRRLGAFGFVVLAISFLTCSSHFWLMRMSIDVASGIRAAQCCAVTDIYARDTLDELRDNSTFILTAARDARVFVETENIPQLSEPDLLEQTNRPPFRGWLIGTFTVTVVWLKTGILLLAAALCSRGRIGPADH